MALKLDNSLLEELGLGALPEAEKQLLLRQIYEKLEMNVGMRLADQMSNEQLDAFEKFVDANDDKGAFQWLEQNFPNYKMVVNEEFEKLKAEIRSVAPQILASAQQQAAQGQMAGPAGPGVGQQAQPQQQGQPQYAPQPQQQGAYQQQPQYQAPVQQNAGPQPQYQQQPLQPQYQPPQPPQQQYQPSAAPQAPPVYGQPPQPGQPGAMPQNGHLQPQYGAPLPNSQPPQTTPTQSQDSQPPEQPQQQYQPPSQQDAGQSSQ